MPFAYGAVLMFAVARLGTPDRAVLEGRGVVPDSEVGLSRELLLEGVDSQLAAAAGYLTRRHESIEPR